MFLRQLTYLVALDETRHFGRAAERCNVSQPALSSGLKQLETELGIVIIRRNRRFAGLTEEGARVLAWARQTLGALDGLRQEAAFAQEISGGSLSIGVMPSALQAATVLLDRYRGAIPGLHLEVVSGSATDIIRAVRDRELHLGVAYLDQLPESRAFDTLMLYREAYVLAAAASVRLPPGRQCGWEDAAQFPLCLLGREMRSRQIVDAGFRQAGLAPRIVLETNTLSLIHSELRSGRSCSVLPEAALPEPAAGSVLQTRLIVPADAPEVGLIRLGSPAPTSLLAMIWELSRPTEPITAGS